MSAVGWRRLLHATHALATLLLLASGFLMQAPDLRARLLGGYGRETALLHEAAGAAFVAIPLVVLARKARPLVRDARRRLGPPDPISWRKVHIVLSLVATPLLAATGIVLWLDAAFPLALSDLALEVHGVLSWLFLAMLAVHLVAARRKIVSRSRDLLRGTPPPEDPDELLGLDPD